MASSKFGLVAAFLLCAGAMAFLGHYELHTDDTGVEVGLLAITAFTLGCLDPARAWLWPLLVAASIPGAELLFGKGAVKGLPIVAVVVMAIALVAGYAGAFARRAVFSAVKS